MQTPASTITTTGDLGGQKVPMGFHADSIAHLMSVLTDLYSDPEGAVIREYSTNARDSHIEAGNTAPIEVSTPSPYSPYFRVVDHGVGLSVDDIVEIYSQYGASTKRGTNDQVGMLGLGAKSALTLVPQFHLTSVKDGVKIFVSISRSGDGTGQMEIVDTRATDEPNGVEISIPVSNNRNFESKCKEFFRFWPQGTVLLNGKEPEQITGRPVGSKFIVNSDLPHDYVVMGGVAYPVKDSLWVSRLWNAMGIVAQVEIGDVNFTPSREELHYTPKTKDTIERLKKEFRAQLTDSAIKDVAESKTWGEAWNRSVEWNSKFSLNNLTFKGQPLPSREIRTQNHRRYDIGAGRSYSNSRRSWIDAKDFKDTLIVINFTNAELTMSSQQREKARIFAVGKGWSLSKVIALRTDKIADAADQQKFFGDFHVADWDDIKDIKIPRVSNGTTTVRTEPYDLWVDYYTTRPVKTFDTTLPIIYFSSADIQEPKRNQLPADAQIVRLSRNRWDKFKRDWPTARQYWDAVNEYRASLLAQVTEDDKILWHYGQYNSSYQWIRSDKVDDPDVKRFVKVLNDMKMTQAATTLKIIYAGAPVSQPANPLTKYPLAARLYSDPEHGYWYLNSYYTHLKENNNGNPV